MNPTTKREVLIAREGFRKGYREHHRWFGEYRDEQYMLGNKVNGAWNHDEQEAATLKAYPLPKVTRPRVVVDSDGDEWTLHPVHGLRLRYDGRGVWEAPCSTDFLGFEATVADLLARPTEEVDDV